MKIAEGRWLRWIHEYLFSLNVAWAIVRVEGVDAKYLGGPAIASYFIRIFRKSIGNVGSAGVLEQIVWPLILATVAFAFLRLFSRFAMTDVTLRTIAGAAAIGAFPLAFWISPDGFPRYATGAHYIGLSLDVIAVSSCAILYYLRKLPLAGWLMLIALLIHFTICAWATGSYRDIPDCIQTYQRAYNHSWERTLSVCSLWTIFHFGFPVLGFSASVSWMGYVRRVPDPASRAATKVQ